MKRKLGIKNGISFLIIIVLFIFITSIFAYFINYEMKKNDNTYNITSGSILFDYKNDYIELQKNGILNRGFDRNYYLSYKDNNEVSYKQKIGPNIVVYRKDDYKIYLYGIAYMISSNGEVEKVSNKTEIIKSGSPCFFKLSDRKYLFIDKKLGTEDGSIKATDYLLIELDKKGNATFINNENNIKTIKPLILKGTQYDFDIANEKLIISKEKQIDLKTIIGSSNTYEKKKNSNNNESFANNSENVSDNKSTNNNTNYYDNYLGTIKNSFNNLFGSVNGMNENIHGQLNKKDAYLDLTRWTVLKSVVPYVNSLNIKYSVFDSNNEYSEVFAYITYQGKTDKIQLSKTGDSYMISNLIPDTEYQIQYGYRLVSAVGDPSMDIITDNIRIKTLSLNYQINITKVTTNKIYYNVSFNNNSIPDSVIISLYLNDILSSSKTILKNDINKSGIYTGSFDYSSLSNFVSLKLHSVVYDGTLIDYSSYAKFIN